VFDLEFGQLNSDVASATIGGLQKLFQLDAVLQVQFLNFGQTVLLLGHDDVQGQLLLLSWKANDGFHNLDDFHGLLVQWVELGLFCDVSAHLRSPVGFDGHGVDQDHFGVVGDGVLRNDAVEFVLSPLRDPLVDDLTALLGLAMEVALFNVGTEGILDQLHEGLLSRGGLVDEDTSDGFDLG